MHTSCSRRAIGPFNFSRDVGIIWAYVEDVEVDDLYRLKYEQQETPTFFQIAISIILHVLSIATIIRMPRVVLNGRVLGVG